MKLRQVQFQPYILALGCSLLLMATPERASDAIRENAVGIVSPLWRVSRWCAFLASNSSGGVETKSYKKLKQDSEDLKLKNHLLEEQLGETLSYLLSEKHLESELGAYKAFQEEGTKTLDKDFFQRRQKELQERLALQMESIQANVIYRPVAFWNRSLWINKGEKYNTIIGKRVIQKNSPVTLGNVAIGKVDYVGRNKSRVKLITDPKLCLSVRAVRGQKQNDRVFDSVEELYNLLQDRQDIFFSSDEHTKTLEILKNISSNVLTQSSTSFLAKGELHGADSKGYRTLSNILVGEGFNYDFADEEGPARDLRIGTALGEGALKHQEGLLKEGDLLVTTGMDGIFPANLEVGIVKEIEPLEDGAFHYKLYAKSLCKSLNQLVSVTVLPPVDQD